MKGLEYWTVEVKSKIQDSSQRPSSLGNYLASGTVARSRAQRSILISFFFFSPLMEAGEDDEFNFKF